MSEGERTLRGKVAQCALVVDGACSAIVACVGSGDRAMLFVRQGGAEAGDVTRLRRVWGRRRVLSRPAGCVRGVVGVASRGGAGRAYAREVALWLQVGKQCQ